MGLLVGALVPPYNYYTARRVGNNIIVAHAVAPAAGWSGGEQEVYTVGE